MLDPSYVILDMAGDAKIGFGPTDTRERSCESSESLTSSN